MAREERVGDRGHTERRHEERRVHARDDEQASNTVRFAQDLRPSPIAPGTVENSFVSSTRSATPLAIWLPLPIASLDSFSASTSLTPSPAMAT
jgi:hypothetical protein